MARRISASGSNIQPYPRIQDNEQEAGLLDELKFPKKYVTSSGAVCDIIEGDSREELQQFYGQVDLIVTSPPYADARSRHYDSVHPDDFAD